MMADLIDRQAAINAVHRVILALFDYCNDIDEPMTYREKQYLSINKTISEHIKALPSVDAVDVVRCKDCKHRWVNEHYGEKGYMKIKAMCSLDTDDPFELGRNAYDDDWFCADGERKDG